MLKKITALAAALTALATSALAIEPTMLTETMYEKAINTGTLDISDSGNMTAVYLILALLVVFVAVFWLMDRKNRRAMKEIQQELTRRNQANQD